MRKIKKDEATTMWKSFKNFSLEMKYFWQIFHNEKDNFTVTTVTKKFNTALSRHRIDF